VSGNDDQAERVLVNVESVEEVGSLGRDCGEVEVEPGRIAQVPEVFARIPRFWNARNQGVELYG